MDYYKSIVRNGYLLPIDKEAHVCPCCGDTVKEYEWEQIRMDEMTLGEACEIMGESLDPPLVPTFSCPKCRCRWQWLKNVCNDA